MSSGLNLSNHRLGAYLIKGDFFTEEKLQHHDINAKRDNLSLLTYLSFNQLFDESHFFEQASCDFGLPILDLHAFNKNALPLKIISERIIRTHHCLPLIIRNNLLFLAISDPTNLAVIEDVQFQTQLQTIAILVEETKLSQIIDGLFDKPINSLMDEMLADSIQLIDNQGDIDATENLSRDSDIDDAPVVRYVNQILLQAIQQGVSDIHMEPYEKVFRIRFRLDGILHAVANPPVNIAHRLVSRLKIMSKIDIAERRIPQDGRIKAIAGDQTIDFRVNTCPTLFGEKVVLRILDPQSAQLGIEKLGLDAAQQRLFLQAIHRPYGLVLVTGPTGSGKTVTLYTGLTILNTIERNISTAEDPVEITVEGINQVNVNPKAGLNFAVALRAFLRQDPDVIMVGEIRDLETAEIAVKAAQTGHLVLSTLHTNDAPQTLNRLLQMGVPAFNIVSAINLIIAQRLPRRLCLHCRQLTNYPEQILLEAGFKAEEIGQLQLYHAIGCDQCNQGYRGRIGIYQVIAMTEKIRDLVLNGANATQIAQGALAEGFDDLRRSGLNKVRLGLTSLEEVDRITME